MVSRQTIKIVVGVILATAIISMVGAIILITVRSTATCELAAENPLPYSPKTSEPQAVPIGSSDNSALISFLGYFTFADTSKKAAETYLALEARKVEVKKSEDGKRTTEVQIIANCATLNIKLKHTDDRVSVGSIEVELAKPHRGITSCTIPFPGISFGPHNHYYCWLGVYNCLEVDANGKWLSVLFSYTVRDLKIEIDRASTAEEGEYSTKVQPCQ